MKDTTADLLYLVIPMRVEKIGSHARSENGVGSTTGFPVGPQDLCAALPTR